MSYKKFKICDIGLIKLSSFVGALFLISVWPAFANWVTETYWVWFLVVAIILAIKPLMTVFKK
jgi:hypothetical protein